MTTTRNGSPLGDRPDVQRIKYEILGTGSDQLGLIHENKDMISAMPPTRFWPPEAASGLES